MSSVSSAGMDRPFIAEAGAESGARESSHSAVSWAAIFCGAFAAIAVTLVLATLGAGLDLLTVSPWPNSGASATTFTIMTGIGLIVVQWIASGIGGYITGRLRTRWVGVHTHEVFFRDTAHGFIAWTLATVIGVMFLASAASSVVGGGIRAASTAAGGAAQGAGQRAAEATSAATSGISGYDVDSLFRTDRPDPNASAQDVTGQATRILASGIANGDVPPADRTYLAQLVAARTGVPQPDAQKRVDDVIARVKTAETKARQAADAARKATSQLAIFTALSMLIGAFIASAAAAYGGSLRDEH